MTLKEFKESKGIEHMDLFPSKNGGTHYKGEDKEGPYMVFAGKEYKTKSPIQTVEPGKPLDDGMRAYYLSNKKAKYVV